MVKAGRTVAAVSAALLLVMAGIALGRWSLLHKGAVLEAGGSTVALTSLILREAGSTGQDVPRKININTASADELRELPGIGEALSERIVAYRQANGDFRSIEELKAVRGIGDSLLARLETYITVN